jgi:hypothetical protein
VPRHVLGAWREGFDVSSVSGLLTDRVKKSKSLISLHRIGCFLRSALLIVSSNTWCFLKDDFESLNFVAFR